MYKNKLCSVAARPALRSKRIVPIGLRRYASTFNWEDPLNATSLFTDEELAIQETAHSYCQERMLPRVLGTL